MVVLNSFLVYKRDFSIRISLNFVPSGKIKNKSELVLMTAWHRTGDKSLSEPMMI